MENTIRPGALEKQKKRSKAWIKIGVFKACFPFFLTISSACITLQVNGVIFRISMLAFSPPPGGIVMFQLQVFVH